ncbi:MAG: beta-phosphoglucomutase [Petroclostridium sp.]|jgi:beta-phosphoglucomutase family hydrolase|nr:haloacid dehalogenase superfamily protein [Clostridia bacterium]MDK2809946.1 beta-phosphoglucomutase [Petroclostridium sp.]
MKAVIFDMDGVIVDNSEYHRKAWHLYIEKKGLKVNQEKLDKMYGLRNIEFVRILFGQDLSDQEVAVIGREKEQLYREIYLEDIKPPEGLIEYLDYIKEKGLKIAIASSACIENVDFTIDNLHIRKYFDVILSEQDVTKGKPAPDVYLKAAGKLGVPPEKCVVIEDAVAGVEAGKRAGMYVVAITTSCARGELNKADVIVDSFYDEEVRRAIER